MQNVPDMDRKEQFPEFDWNGDGNNLECHWKGFVLRARMLDVFLFEYSVSYIGSIRNIESGTASTMYLAQTFAEGYAFDEYYLTP